MQQDMIAANLACKDGSKWNAYHENGNELTTEEKCGICTKRDGDKYSYCNYTEDSANYYSSWEYTDKQYKRTYTAIEFILYPAIFCFVMLLIVKGVAKAIVYIVAGSKQ
jgi:hypothetical protein